MKAKILLTFISLIPLLAKCQYFRDRFIGTYQCRYESHTTHGIFYGNELLYVDSSSADTSNIIITDSIAWLNYEYVVNSDSSFEHIVVPNIKYGQFYSTDSLFLYDLYDSPAYRVFYGQKLSTGLNDLVKKEWYIFPNPAKEIIFISSKQNFNKIYIFNSFGQIVLEKQLQSAAMKTQIDLPQLPDGIYFLKIQSDKNSSTQKVIIQN